MTNVDFLHIPATRSLVIRRRLVLLREQLFDGGRLKALLVLMALVVGVLVVLGLIFSNTFPIIPLVFFGLAALCVLAVLVLLLLLPSALLIGLSVREGRLRPGAEYTCASGPDGLRIGRPNNRFETVRYSAISDIHMQSGFVVFTETKSTARFVFPAAVFRGGDDRWLEQVVAAQESEHEPASEDLSPAVEPNNSRESAAAPGLPDEGFSSALPVRSRRHLTSRGYLALVVSLLMAAMLWTLLLGAGRYFADSSITYFPLPGVFGDPGWWLNSFEPLAIPVTIIIDIVAGARGGANRVAGIVGGGLLASPALLIFFAIAFGSLIHS